MKIVLAGILVAACLFLEASEGSASLLEENCGTTKRPLRVRRVVGGVAAERFANPWMVMVFSEKRFLCGGSLITSRFVLTAANCLSELPISKVRLGGFDMDISENTYEVNIDRNISHPQFALSTPKYDIALLRMAQEVSFSDYIRPICLLVNQKVPNTNPNFKLTGWGKTKDHRTNMVLGKINSGEMSRILQTTNLQIADLSFCNRKGYNLADQSHICAGSSTSDACHGDGGSPLSAELNYEGAIREFQFGIVSYGSTSCNDYGVYTNVTHYMDWIKDTIHANSV
ncbi:serine protease grass-like [Drosophila subpulchrella]|uniref:serine protease grass-like n=1 Tax=Drosophila subpulchrella TaxID=1486046 RepID=UPI0018A1B32C|nr:serine protease grass-like [Drosophila subpulchrella]